MTIQETLDVNTLKVAFFIASDTPCFEDAQRFTEEEAARLFRKAGASPKAADMLSALLSLGIMHASAEIITKGGDL